MLNKQHSLIKQLKAKGIRSERVLKAISNVDRKKFVPRAHENRAYADGPLPIGQGQTISQPYIVAFMTEKLDIRPDDKVLEIGTGSGYQLAILAELTPYVFSIESRELLLERARKNLAEAGCKSINLKAGDGYDGWEEHSPFDRIILTAAAVHIPPPLTEQLACNGRMVLPLGARDEIQRLLLVTKDERGKINKKSLESVRFVPMEGRAQEASPE